MSEATVGQIVGFLRLDAAQFFAEIDKAERRVDDLGRKSPDVNVKVKADTGGAEAKIAAVGRSAKQSATGLDAAALSSRRLSDASSAVSIAQQRLSELQDTGKAKASQLASAEAVLARAHRAEADAVMSTYDANIKLDDSNKKVESSNKKVDKSSRDAGKGLGLMATSIITLGPALVPLSAAAVGLGGALGGMGAAGILAIVGVKKEMAAGTVTGNKYAAQINTLKGNLDTLSHTAAAGVLSAFQKDVSNLQGQMPFLNGMVSHFSTLLGRSSTNLLTGVIAGMHVLEPLMMQAGVYIDGLTSKFAAAAGGAGMQAFADYARSVLPQVAAALESISGAVVKLASSFSTSGLGVTAMITMMSDAINAIPLPILTQLTGLATAGAVAFAAWQGMAGFIGGVETALLRLGAAEATAAAATRVLSMAAGGISIVLAVAAYAFAQHQQSVAKDQQAVDSLTDAFKASHGAIDQNIRDMQIKALMDSGAYDAARRLGVGQDVVTNAALGNKAAITQLNSALDAQSGNFEKVTTNGRYATRSLTDSGKAAATLKGAVDGSNATLDKGRAAWQLYNSATTSAATGSAAQTAALQRQASAMGTTSDALLNAMAGQKKTADAAAATTLQMQLENDAAGLLKGALDALNGKALSAADAQNAFDSSLTSMSKVAGAARTHINGMSTAAVGLRGNLNGQIHALQGVIEANGGLANSTGKARAQMATMRAQIINNAVAHGVDRAAVTAYIDKLLKVPKSVPPTKLDVDKRNAEAKLAALKKQRDDATSAKQIYVGAGVTQALSGLAAVRNAANSLHDVSINVVTHYRSVGSPALQNNANRIAASDRNHANGGTIEGHAFGGTVGGHGGPRADDQPFMGPRGLVMLSSGEEVIRNGPAQKYRPLLKAINAGKFAGGGTIGAAGPAPDMAEIMSLFSAGVVTRDQVKAAQARVTSARKSVTTATTSLHNYRVADGAAGRSVRAARANLSRVEHSHGSAAQRRAAEDRLTSALEHQRKVNGQVTAAEDRLAAARKGVTAATKAANAAAAAYKRPAIDQFASATKSSNKMSSSFLKNLTTLASRGFVTLSRSLLEDGSPQAQSIAAQAVRSTAKAKHLEADLKASAKTEAGLHALDDKLNGVNQPPTQLKPVTLRAGESLTIGGQVIKGSPTKVFPQPGGGSPASYGQSQVVHLSDHSLGQLVRGIAARPVSIDGKSLAAPMNTELVRGLR